MNSLSIDNINKRYEDKSALHNLSIEIGKNSIYGIIGPNGAGKTTLLNIILGLLKRDSGVIRVDDVEYVTPYSVEQNKTFGYLPDTPMIFEYLTGLENMQFLSHLYKVKCNNDQLIDYMKETGIDSAKDTLVGDYSKGMKQRLSISSLFIYNPQIIIMDEPTTSLDPIGVSELKSIIRRLKEEGKTIIIATHDMGFVEDLCDNISIIHEGSVLFSGEIKDIYRLSMESKLEDVITKLVYVNRKGEI